ncbi:DUF6776 family protein [Catenovulum sediminis]|uniref:DUF6776 family protein n=1 Tax=Catenovulum sediminis TaxID=1740262 RepID=A0ABV1RMI6_9ALTE|nr:DUF6776 family protein [Catenovulum sediminis]
MTKQVFKNLEIISKANMRFYSGLFGLGVLLLALMLGFNVKGWMNEQQAKDMLQIQQQIEEKDSELFQLEQKLNFMRVELEVNNLSLQQMQKELKAQQQENRKLKELVTFYQSVMAPELNADGVMVDDVFIEPTLVHNQFRYKVILVQTSKQKKFAKGYIELTLQGIQNGKNAEFPVKSLSLADNDLSFSFRYFQILEGEFVVPENASIERVNLAVILPRRRGQEYSRTELDFDWSPQVIHRE